MVSKKGKRKEKKGKKKNSFLFFSFLYLGKTDMELGKRVFILDWEWGRNSAPRDGQKIPCIGCQHIAIWTNGLNQQDKVPERLKIYFETLLHGGSHTRFHEVWGHHLNVSVPNELMFRTLFLVRNENLILSFLNQNICCGYSKEPSQRDGSF